MISAEEARSQTNYILLEEQKQKEEEAQKSIPIRSLKEAEEYITKGIISGTATCAFYGTLSLEDINTLKDLGYKVRLYKCVYKDFNRVLKEEPMGKKYIFWGPEETYSHFVWEPFEMTQYCMAVSWDNWKDFKDDYGVLLKEY